MGNTAVYLVTCVIEFIDRADLIINVGLMWLKASFFMEDDDKVIINFDSAALTSLFSAIRGHW